MGRCATGPSSRARACALEEGRGWSWAQRFAPGRRCAIERFGMSDFPTIEGVCSWCRRARCVSHTRSQSGVIAARGSIWLPEIRQKVRREQGWPGPPQQIIPRCWNIISKIKLKLKLEPHAGIVYVSRITGKPETISCLIDGLVLTVSIVWSYPGELQNAQCARAKVQ